MRFKTLLFHKELSLLIFRSTGWISILSFFALLLSLPLQIIMLDKKELKYYEEFPVYDSLFDIHLIIPMAVIIMMPILLAIFLFRFLHNKAYSDLIHSLPIKRSFLFHYYTITGLILLILPILLNAIIIRIIHSIYQIDMFFTVNEITNWFYISTIFSILLYLATIFIGMLTGISIMQGVFSVLFLLFPAGIVTIVLYNLGFWLYGFPLEHYLSDDIFLLSPILVPAIITSNDATVIHYAVYTIFAFLFYLFSLVLYKTRKVESVSQVITFPFLKGIIICLSSLCFALLSGIYVETFQQNSNMMLIIGYIVGSFAGYLIGQMFMEKTWRVFNKVKGFVVFLLIMIPFFLLSVFIGNRYEDYVPKVEDVRSIRIADEYLTNGSKMSGELTGEELKNLVELHQDILNDKPNMDEYNDHTAFITLNYQLKNNQKMIRSYVIDRSNYKQWLIPVYENEKFKQTTSSMFSLDVNDVKEIRLQSAYQNDVAIIGEKKEMKELLSSIQKDWLKETYEDMVKNYSFTISMDITYKGNEEQVYFSINPSYIETKEWLLNNAFMIDPFLASEDIEKVAIFLADKLDMENENIYNSSVLEQIVEDIEGKILVNEPEQIKQLINQTVYSKEKYAIYFKLKGKNQADVFYISEMDIPNAIKQQLK